MLDTIKVAIPLTKGQHKRLIDIEMSRDQSRSAWFNPVEGTIELKRVSGLAEMDQHSYHRELMWDIRHNWEQGTRLYLEFSVPKFWYGHNIHLLYNWFGALAHLKKLLEEQFNLTRMKLPPVELWEVLRFDACYAWRFPTQRHAESFLDSLKHLKFPYKEPVIRKTSIFFPGKTYSVKAYLKNPEFVLHDMKALIKQGASLEWINHLEKLSEGVLRFEVTCRHLYLQRRALPTVGHFLEDKAHVIWDKACSELSNEEKGKCTLALVVYMNGQEPGSGTQLWKALKSKSLGSFKSGTHFSMPAAIMTLMGESGQTFQYRHPGGGFRFYGSGQPLAIVQEKLKQFVGEGEMHSDSQVHEALSQIYKSNKAGHLTAFWVYCQRFGIEKAKETFGRNPFYEQRADLKKAGIDLIERPDNVVFLDDEFFHKFNMKAPNEFRVNDYDDFREGTNILNFPKQA
jgi:Phage replication protein CRI